MGHISRQSPVHQIRPYEDRDYDKYAETLLKTWPCQDIQEACENVAMAVRRTRENENEEIWVAEAEGRAVGFVLLGFPRVWGYKGESFEEEVIGIDWFDVHPSFQGKGVAEELLRKAEERGSKRSFISCLCIPLSKILP